MKAQVIAAAFVFCSSAFAEKDFFGLPAATARTAPEIQPLADRFAAAMQAAAGAQNEKRAKLDAEYLASLEVVFKQIAATGDLDATLQVKAEKERIQKGEPLPEQVKTAMVPLLRTTRDKYERALEPLQAEQRTAENAARRQYVVELDQLQKELTKRTELEKAIAVKAERERIAGQLPATPGAPKTSGATVPASANPATAFQMQGFFDKLKVAATNPRILKNTLSKRERGKPFQDIPKEGAYLVGFELTKGDWFGAPLYRSLQPIYMSAAGKVRGAVYGKPGSDPFVVEARDGYAVGTLSFLDGNFFWSLQITFMKVDPFHRNLDRNDSYKTELYGDLTRHEEKPKTVGGDGAPIIGIFGFAADEMNALGIIPAQ